MINLSDDFKMENEIITLEQTVYLQSKKTNLMFFTGWSKEKIMIESVAYIKSLIEKQVSNSFSISLNT